MVNQKNIFNNIRGLDQYFVSGHFRPWNSQKTPFRLPQIVQVGLKIFSRGLGRTQKKVAVFLKWVISLVISGT